MKKIFLLFAWITVFISGCSQSVDYTTKYIVECQSAELRDEPENSSVVLGEVMHGEAVSFEKDVQNGYSKVVYNGVSGYVLSVYLSEEKPNTTVVEVNDDEYKEENLDNSSEYSYLISDLEESYIEQNVVNVIRPLFNRVNNNINSYSKSVSNDASSWHDDNTCVKKVFSQGTRNYNMIREYYYDESGSLTFAFVHNSSYEHRLYFLNDKLIRYIDSFGEIINNPQENNALKMADRALDEAYLN